MIAIYPGSFDPLTLGHLDIIKRSARMFDTLIVGVLQNHNKTPMFTTKERVDMIEIVTQDIPNVKVKAFDGMLVDFARDMGANTIVRGLRAITDFEYELQMSQTNRILNPQVDTVFFTTSLEYAYLSSSTVKEVAHFGGDYSAFVPEVVREKMCEKLKN
jgi:pantetheine-phosphate adenylyltransferase